MVDTEAFVPKWHQVLYSIKYWCPVSVTWREQLASHWHLLQISAGQVILLATKNMEITGPNTATWTCNWLR